MNEENNSIRAVFRRVWPDKGLQEALFGLYFFEQSMGGSYVASGQTENLISLGLAERAGGRPVLTSTGVSLAYNLLEYRNQVEQDSVGPVLNRMKFDAGSIVLDVGCGGGQTLFAIQKFRPQEVCGVDRDKYGIAFADFVFRQQGIPEGKFTFRNVASEDYIPPPGKFTHLICRVALHKWRINRNLSGFNRGLAPAGRIYLMVPTLSYYFSRLKMVRRNPKRIGYFLFVIFNGLLFSVTGLQLTLKLGKKRISELFLTGGSLKRALNRSGFQVEFFPAPPKNERRAMLEVFGRKGGIAAADNASQ